MYVLTIISCYPRHRMVCLAGHRGCDNCTAVVEPRYHCRVYETGWSQDSKLAWWLGKYFSLVENTLLQPKCAKHVSSRSADPNRCLGEFVRS